MASEVPGDDDRVKVPGKAAASGQSEDGSMPNAAATPTLADRLRKDLRNPLFLQAYALMINTAITAVLGLGYWVLATRLYSPAAFGEGQTMISAMRLFSSLTGLAFVGAMARFIPVAGRRTSEFVLRGYGVAGATGVVAALAFLLTLPLWGPAYAQLGGFGPGLFFLVSVLVWTIFTLQDVTLAGLRRAVWVPANSLGFGLVKMVLLAALAFALPEGGLFGGIFLSWIIPTAMALIPINWFIFRHAIPRHVERTEDDPPRLREIGRFLAGDFPGALSLLLTLYLVPVLIAAWLNDATVFGYFSVTHTLGCMIGLLAANMAVSLTVEGSFHPAELARSVRNALRRTVLIVVPIVAIVTLAAPLILTVFSAELAEATSPLLRLMALAVLPGILIEIHLSTLRTLRQARRLAIVQIGLAVIMLGLIAVLFPLAGVTGVGYAVLAANAVVALAVVPHLRRVAVVS
ncbi:lipopolysaccharide biosynthesis protein [Nonomuraea dietziae]|uniref:lipopolysaccharide biosynthesis protein n=1 Tax=Nonomuraea dietziae TaxID=65515 RepID=UPI0033E0F7A9